METVNVSGLKNNPSEALRKARKDLVVVMNRDQPEALLVHLDENETLALPGVKLALATALYRDGQLSIARSARLAGVAVGDFMDHVSRLGIPVVRLTPEETRRDMETLDEWLAAS